MDESPDTRAPSPNPASVPALRRFLENALAEPLPKASGQALMAPRPRTGWKPDFLPEDCRDAAALLLIYPKHDQAHILLTVRTDHLPTHQGQVSLPGGGVGGGETVVDAALRELSEEVGIGAAEIEVLGALSPLHIPVSGFILHPVVAAMSGTPSVSPGLGEVARILEAPVADLAEPHCVRVETRYHEGQAYRIPYFMVEDCKIWGATAMVLSEFLCLIGFAPSGDQET